MQRTNIYMALFWLLMFIGLYVFFDKWDKNQKNKYIAYALTQSEMVIPRGVDGHYRIQGEVNHYPVEFLIDTGATQVTISEALSKRAGLEGGTNVVFETANGKMNGKIVANVPVMAGQLTYNHTTVGVGLVGLAENQALLGQSFLNHFDIQIEGNQMILKARQNK